MKADRFPLVLFGDTPPGQDHILTVPYGSKFLKLIAFNNGIYAYYEIPEVQSTSTKEDRFHFLAPDETVPAFFQFIDILSIPVQTTKGLGMMVYVVYKHE